MTASHVVLTEKRPGSMVDARLYPNVDRALRESGDGKLIYCNRCLEKMHCAAWVSDGEVLRRWAVFRDDHKDCKL